MTKRKKQTNKQINKQQTNDNPTISINIYVFSETRAMELTTSFKNSWNPARSSLSTISTSVTGAGAFDDVSPVAAAALNGGEKK